MILSSGSNMENFTTLFAPPFESPYIRRFSLNSRSRKRHAPLYLLSTSSGAVQRKQSRDWEPERPNSVLFNGTTAEHKREIRHQQMRSVNSKNVIRGLLIFGSTTVIGLAA